MANNDVQHLLDMLYEMIDGAKNAPLTSDKCILNRDEALDLLDEIRAQLPVELSRAQELIKKAEDRSREMYRVANEYTEDALRRTEEAIQMALEEVKQSRVRFRAASAEQMQKRREELAQSAEKQTQNG